MNNKVECIKLLMSTNRPGMDKLVKHMEDNGFFTSPCSTRHHLAEQNGLLKHSMNVYNVAKSIKKAVNSDVSDNSLIIACLLHDLGKMGQFGKPYYVEKILKSGKVGVEPYMTNHDLMYIPHEVRSISIANQFIQLTEDEQFAILFHNGKYTKVGYEMAEETPLQMILHFSDLYCSRVVEKEQE